MSNDDVSYLVENDEVWRCDPCAQTRRKSMVLESKTSVSYDDVLKLVTEIKDDFKRVETSLGGSLNACHEEIAQIKDLINKQREELTAWAKIAEDLRSENASLRRQVSSLEARVDEAEQYSRRNTLEIHGIPVEKDSATRDGSGKPPGIVVKMVRRLDAEGLLQKRRVKRNLNTHDLGHTSRPADVVYVNESLAPGRRKLLNAARQVKKDKAYTYLWIRGSKILMRKNAGDRVKVVTTMDDLAN
ncbi:uncharacterized protein LOC124374417, partial [Homalodisca vitripennis]|uniref:uncharacterized protein LOC124374417 n=1 Tax=Homalodisca vitripennis TaxID=197043 RepID=UPI001EEAACF4